MAGDNGLDGRGTALVELSCSEFASELAARKAAPGGGGAAALVGALGASLCSMAGNFTLGKARYADVEPDVRRMLSEAQDARERLLALVDEDARAFLPVSAAHRLPKDDPARAGAIEEATKGACRAPLEMMEQCARVIVLLEEMGEKGSYLLLADVGCGAYLARAAMEAASLNVYANTSALTDRAFAKSAETRCEALLSEYVPRAEALAQRVADALGGAR